LRTVVFGKLEKQLGEKKLETREVKKAKLELLSNVITLKSKICFTCESDYDKQNDGRKKLFCE
jgi:hypothetical protein